MKPKKHLASILMIMLIFLGISACGTTKNQVKKGQNSKGAFVYEEITKREDFYKDIKGAVNRLRAMICGKYVHQTPALVENDGKETTIYKAWKPQGSKDSVMVCQIPAGDHNKIGFWVYHYQYLSSLPDDPVFQGFTKMEPLNRDTIKAVFYEVPEGFTVNLNQNVNEIKASFDEIEWHKLKVSERYGTIYYVRQTPIKFLGLSSVYLDQKMKSNANVAYARKYFSVEYDNILFGTKVYDKDKKFISDLFPDRFLKLAEVHPDLY